LRWWQSNWHSYVIRKRKQKIKSLCTERNHFIPLRVK
jgi:hypothetical protein